MVIEIKETKKVHVGLVMPIAQIDNCGPEHWLEVKSIITDALSSNDHYHFETRLVSDSDSSGLIHKRIVQGLYNSDIVICDVSCKNPNVMFELGMRLAFDKPTIIIKDDKTNYSFDTGGIEHIEYPRDLRFTRIVEFKNTLVRKTIATLEDAEKDPNHSPFLKSFGEFKVAKLDQTEVMPFDLIVNQLTEMQTDIAALKSAQLRSINNLSANFSGTDSDKTTLSPRMLNILDITVMEYLSNLESDTAVNLFDLINHCIRVLRNNDINLDQVTVRRLRHLVEALLHRAGREYNI